MSTLHKFKAYFGMVPLEDYEDEYLDDPASGRRDRDRDYGEAPYGGYAPSHRDEYAPSHREEPVREIEHDEFDRHIWFDLVKDSAGVVQRRSVWLPDRSVFDKETDGVSRSETL